MVSVRWAIAIAIWAFAGAEAEICTPARIAGVSLSRSARPSYSPETAAVAVTIRRWCKGIRGPFVKSFITHLRWVVRRHIAHDIALEE